MKTTQAAHSNRLESGFSPGEMHPGEATMGLKEHEYIRQTLERYTNCPLEEICDHILITNFKQYVRAFHEKTSGDFREGNFRIVNARDINCTMIDFGIGSPQAVDVSYGCHGPSEACPCFSTGIPAFPGTGCFMRISSKPRADREAVRPSPCEANHERMEKM